MIITPVFVGIDVSKSMLDVFDPVHGASRVRNQPEALATLAGRLAEQGRIVVYEATGHYDSALGAALAQAGVSHARVNPAQARDFARAFGVKAKTDPVDARLLAEMGHRLDPRRRTAVDHDREHLTALHRRRDQLVHARQQERTRHAEETHPAVLEDLARHLAYLDAAIQANAKQIEQAIAANRDLQNRAQRLRTTPGVGPVTATTLLALMPELGTLSSKQAASLAGLAPYNVDSGAFRGRRTVRGGRKRVRDALYMAAVSLARSSTALGRWYARLREQGKPPKLALIALARKLLITLNAMLRDNTDFKTT